MIGYWIFVVVAITWFIWAFAAMAVNIGLRIPRLVYPILVMTLLVTAKLFA